MCLTLLSNTFEMYKKRKSKSVTISAEILKKSLQLLKKVSSTSFQVIDRINDTKIVYVSKLANKINFDTYFFSEIKPKKAIKKYELNILIS